MKARILHIEDRRENRLLVRKLLEVHGFEVTDAVDGLTGLEMAREIRPDLVLLDINIPSLDGYEVVTRLKGDPTLAATPVVAITAEGDRDRSIALGFDGFISKPIRMVSFADELGAFLGGHRETIDDSRRAEHLEDHTRRVVDRLEAKVRELEAANTRLREVDRLKLEVLRNVSHELATPMTPLMGYVKMLGAGELGPISEPQRQVIERMGGSLRRLEKQIDNLLNTTRFATGAVSLDRGVVDVEGIVRTAVETWGASTRVEVNVQGSLDPLVADGREGQARGAGGRSARAIAADRCEGGRRDDCRGSGRKRGNVRPP